MAKPPKGYGYTIGDQSVRAGQSPKRTRSQVAKANFAESKTTRKSGQFSKKSRDIQEAEADAARDYQINVLGHSVADADREFDRRMGAINIGPGKADTTVVDATQGNGSATNGSSSGGADDQPRDEIGRWTSG